MDPRHPISFPPSRYHTYCVVREQAADVASNPRCQIYGRYYKRIRRCGKTQWYFRGMNCSWCWLSTTYHNLWCRRENYSCQILWHCNRSPLTTYPYGKCPPRSLRESSQSAKVHRRLTLCRTNSVLFGEGLPGTTGKEPDNFAPCQHWRVNRRGSSQTPQRANPGVFKVTYTGTCSCVLFSRTEGIYPAFLWLPC